MKRAALYMRVSTVDQHPETQLHDLRGLAKPVQEVGPRLCQVDVAGVPGQRRLSDRERQPRQRLLWGAHVSPLRSVLPALK